MRHANIYIYEKTYNDTKRCTSDALYRDSETVEVLLFGLRLNNLLLGFFLMDRGKRDVDSQIIDRDLRMKKWHSKRNRLCKWCKKKKNYCDNETVDALHYGFVLRYILTKPFFVTICGVCTLSRWWDGRCTSSTHCNTLQHTATHCHTLQHTVTHCNTLQHTAERFIWFVSAICLDKFICFIHLFLRHLVCVFCDW